MTPERREYLEHISEREKALRKEIGIQKDALQNIKFRLSHSEAQSANKLYKEFIKYRKYVIYALKHELERIQPTTDIEYLGWRGINIFYECRNCHKEFSVWQGDTPPSHCPHCHRKIQRDC